MKTTDTELKNEFRTRLKAEIQARKLTYEAAAKGIGVPRPTLSSWIAGDSFPKPTSMRKIEAFLGKRLGGFIVGGEHVDLEDLLTNYQVSVNGTLLDEEQKQRALAVIKALVE